MDVFENYDALLERMRGRIAAGPVLDAADRAAALAASAAAAHNHRLAIRYRRRARLAYSDPRVAEYLGYCQRTGLDARHPARGYYVMVRGSYSTAR